jgi:D-serine deaminase-like pyridoxal phosphate-dependent protein
MPCWYEIANVADIPSPALLVYPDRIEENLRRRAAAGGGAGRLRPHVKTHKMPEVIRLCLSHGIGKFKAATIAEAEMTAASGADDVLLAYPVVGPAARRLAELVRRFPQTHFREVVDSDVGIDDLEAGGLPVSLVVAAGTPTTPILAARGYSAADIEGFFHGNFVNFLRQALPA